MPNIGRATLPPARLARASRVASRLAREGRDGDIVARLTCNDGDVAGDARVYLDAVLLVEPGAIVGVGSDGRTQELLRSSVIEERDKRNMVKEIAEFFDPDGNRDVRYAINAAPAGDDELRAARRGGVSRARPI